MLISIRAIPLVLVLLCCFPAALPAENFIAPFSGNLYVKCVGGSAGAVSQFGTGTTAANFVPYLTGLPGACATGEVFVRAVNAGETVPFAITTQWGGWTYWAFSGGADRASTVAFSDAANSLGMNGNIIQRTSQNTWLMFLDDAASFTFNDNNADMLIQLRLATPVQQILPQFAFGGGWYSALYFTNTRNTSTSFQVSFTGDDGNPLVVPSLGGSSVTVNLAARGTAVVEAPNVGPLSQGYASAALPDGVTGYGIFRASVTGRADQEAVVPFSGASAMSSTLVWDDTNFVTAIAITNLGAARAAVSITVRDGLGAIIGTSSVALGGRSKTASPLRDLPGLSGLIGRRGSAEFTVASGSLAVLGLRFGGEAFTSIPTTDK